MGLKITILFLGSKVPEQLIDLNICFKMSYTGQTGFTFVY
jgi:hypothetical protein